MGRVTMATSAPGPAAPPLAGTVVLYRRGDSALLGPCPTSPCTSSIPTEEAPKGSPTLGPLLDTIWVRKGHVYLIAFVSVSKNDFKLDNCQHKTENPFLN